MKTQSSSTKEQQQAERLEVVNQIKERMGKIEAYDRIMFDGKCYAQIVEELYLASTSHEARCRIERFLNLLPKKIRTEEVVKDLLDFFHLLKYLVLADRVAYSITKEKLLPSVAIAKAKESIEPTEEGSLDWLNDKVIAEFNRSNFA